MAKTIYLEDRSGAEADDACGMKYWWNRHQDGVGIVPASEAIELQVGKETHDDLSFVAESKDPTEAAESGVQIILEGLLDSASLGERERAYRRAGWLAAFALYIEPRIRLQYENVHTEDELILDRTPLWVPTTPDRVLRDRNTKQLVYREWKSTISASQKWLESWKYAIQLHIGMKAVEEELGEKVAFAQIMGLMKGDERDGRLHHPYVWAYRNSNTGEWTHEYTQARSAGWSPAPVWEYPDGLLAWVKRLGADVALSQFPHTGPIMLNERMLDSWVARRKRRQKEIAIFKESCQDDLKLREVIFEQRTNRCAPPFGSPCPYRLACWNASVNADPLKGGEYVKRVPHHEVEINWRKEHGS